MYCRSPIKSTLYLITHCINCKMIPSLFYKGLFNKKTLYHLWSRILIKVSPGNVIISVYFVVWNCQQCHIKKLKWEYPNYQWNQGIRLRTNWDKCFGYTIIHFLLLSRTTTKNMYIRVCERNSCHLNGEFSLTCLLLKFELTRYLGCSECLRCLFFHSPSHYVSV